MPPRMATCFAVTVVREHLLALFDRGITICEENAMIARVWHGYTKPEDAEAYEKMLKPELLPGIGKKKGYRGSYLLRRQPGAEVEFITILLWDSLDDLRAAAGHEDYETAMIPEERRRYLSRFDVKAAHYEVEATHGL
jgi:heme-degrading monooxygenase HmoA